MENAPFVRITRPVPASGAVIAVQRADQLTVVHHDDTISHFRGVLYTLARAGLHVIGADGTETVIARHEILTTHVVLTHRTGEALVAA